VTVRPLIEQWFPAATIGAESLRERGASSALPPINYLHVWWARRPLTASRAAIVASLLPAWPAEDEAAADPGAARARKELIAEFPRGEDEYHQWFVRTLGIIGNPVAARKAIQDAVAAGGKTEGNAYGYDRAFTRSPSGEEIDRIIRLARLRADVDDAPSILDPFAGGGSIPFEAARFGCQSIANELNPVAAAILHGTVDLPAELGHEFASTIMRWGGVWAKRVEERLAPFFPHVHPDERLAYIWAHTVPCPTTGRPTPLAPDYWLARGKAGRDIAVKVVADPETAAVHREIIEGPGAAGWGSRATYKSGVGTSLWTGETFSGDYIRQMATSGRMGEMLLAVSVTRPGKTGRQFRAPSEADVAAVEAAYAEADRQLPRWEIEEIVPTETIDIISNYDRGHRMYGIERWSSFFTRRQLLTIGTSLEQLRLVAHDARQELDSKRGRALQLYLAFALDKAIDYNSRQSSWHATRTTVRNTFDKHNFAFKWAFAEFDGARALLPWAVNQVVDAYTGIAKLAHRPAAFRSHAVDAQAAIYVGSATALPLPSASVDAVITDPPYYDNVMYGECSDYFLVWQRRALRDTWPELGVLPLSDKEAEAVANSSLFDAVATHNGRGRRKPGTKTASELADEHYEQLLTRAFAEAHRVLKHDGVLTVMFTHKRVDAWDTLGQSLLESGFAVHSSWPVHTESEHSLHQAKKNAASSTILLTCRKRGSTEPAYWSDIKGDVAAAAREAASQFSANGMVGIDLTLATFGPALSVLSRRWPVYTGDLDVDGNPTLLRPDVALDLAREEVARLKKRGLLGGRDVEFDRITDWYLLAWSDFKAAEFPSGEALKLSIATHLDLDDLAKQHRVVRATSGTTTLLTPAQRRTSRVLDPDAASWPTLLDALHALMVTYEEDGLAAAQAWLDRTGKRDDPKFNDLIAAALRAIPRIRDRGEFVRAEARTLEGLRATLFDSIPAPEESAESGLGVQGQLAL
jgi:adenine-specific DNA methylase